MNGKPPALRPAPRESTNLLDFLSSLRNDSKYTDLEIQCQGRVFKVHKAIVCGQVEFFASCANLPFQVSGSLYISSSCGTSFESQTGIIKLDDDIPEIVGYLIEFLYTEKYKVLDGFDGVRRSDPKFPASTNSELLVHSRVYTIADKFLIPNLKKLAAERFEIELKKINANNLEVFTPVLRDVFEGSGPDDMQLKDMCTAMAARLYSDLASNEGFVSLCKENGEICFGILEAVEKPSTYLKDSDWLSVIVLSTTIPQIFHILCQRIDIVSHSPQIDLPYIAPDAEIMMSSTPATAVGTSPQPPVAADSTKRSLSDGINPPSKRLATSSLLGVVASLLDDEDYSDLKIRCKDKVFAVHKNIVCKQVDFFAKCVKGPFKESQTGIIDLEDDIPEIVALFIEYLYTGDYQYDQAPENPPTATISNPTAYREPSKPTSSKPHVFGQPSVAKTNKPAVFGHVSVATTAGAISENTTAPETPANTAEKTSVLLIHSQVYTLADKFCVESLKKFASEKFRQAINYLHHPSQMYMFTAVLQTVFEGSTENDRVLKDLCVSFAAQFYLDLVKMDEFKDFCRLNGDVCFEILDNIAERERKKAGTPGFGTPNIISAPIAPSVITQTFVHPKSIVITTLIEDLCQQVGKLFASLSGQ
ncbi:hypothetical protein HYFRA_00007008 [Hymenoscyphus fraxineus]|uniref:BTB domain-containing protein n=1 Tax=Hymenoscyphus fraxineus TaxID=746836 RepID=A0A9N9PKZ2_9HELO|nr:hypothetical protein HYFRA_00007008 [Hymenoscyphus fraxineus]